MNTNEDKTLGTNATHVLASSSLSSTATKKIKIGYKRTCECGPTHINCMTPKEWLKSQLGVWQFTYESRDVRDKKIHPATFPISLARKVIELFTHQGELVLDPFVGSGTTLVAAQDCNRNAVGFDLRIPPYTTENEPIEICNHCGRSVAWGSGRFVNRVPDLNDAETRIANGLLFPEGDYVCDECDQMTSDDAPLYSLGKEK